MTQSNTVPATVGLFGTCGHSIWRQPLVDHLTSHNIDFYNPQLPAGAWIPDRSEEYVQAENFHLKNDHVIIFCVTDETTAQGSLAEIGFSIVDTIRHLNGRFLIVYIDDVCRDVDASAREIETSDRARKLVKSKVEEEARCNAHVILKDNLSDVLSALPYAYHAINNITHLNMRHAN
jgi:hypothetical protein